MQSGARSPTAKGGCVLPCSGGEAVAVGDEMEDDEAAMDLELLLSGPKNEQSLDECMEGVFDCYPQFYSLNVSDGKAAVIELEIEYYIDPSKLDCFLPCSSWGHGRRGPRRRRSSEWTWSQIVTKQPCSSLGHGIRGAGKRSSTSERTWSQIVTKQPCSSLGHGRRGARKRSSSERLGLFAHKFGPQDPSTSGGRNHIGRKNNDHWTEDEVRQLVKGVSSYGVGKWTYMQRKYFEASIRKRDHLKDKWKNLVEACRKENGRMLVHLGPSLIDRIKELDAKYPYPRRSKYN